MLNFLRSSLLLVLVVAAGLTACSGEDALTPGVRPDTLPRTIADGLTIGPSEIVVGIDVSDSISAARLTEIVEALGACLADESLFPADGSVWASVWAYGDTIVAVVDTLTPVTPDNLTNQFGPALQALASDRVTGGSTAVVADLLDAAGGLLAEGSTEDRQILLFASGFADDSAAALASATSLGASGVRISTLGIDTNPEGEELLEGIAAAADGYSEIVAGSLAEACQRALADMLVIELRLTPQSGEAEDGTEYAVAAAVFEALMPENGVEGVDVTVTVVGGPNGGESGSGATGESGVFSFSYTGTGGAGIDTLVASAEQPRTGTALTDTVTVTWSVTPQPPVCDIGGPYAVSVDADTMRVMLDASASTGDGELTYLWTVDSEDAFFDDPSLATPTLTILGEDLCREELGIALVVTAGELSSECEATIVLEDMRVPMLVAGEPVEIWPPNHKLKSFSPEDFLRFEGESCEATSFDDVDFVIVSVSSNELVNDKGDGNTEPDVIVSCPDQLSLRAERQGGGSGRVYTILYRATLGDGSVQEIEALAYVPHDRGDACEGDAPTGSPAYSVGGCADDTGEDD